MLMNKRQSYEYLIEKTYNKSMSGMNKFNTINMTDANHNKKEKQSHFTAPASNEHINTRL